MSSLDIFLLVMVDLGVSTPYDLRERAGLSPGATIPALRRLQSRGYIKAGQTGSRGRTQYSATPKGKSHLQEHRDEHLGRVPDDVDGILRLAALFNARDRVGLRRFMQKAAARRKKSAKMHLSQAEHLSFPLEQTPADRYRWMKQRLDAAREMAEATALARLVKEINSKSR